VAGLTQKELAEVLNFGRQHLSDMETGRRSVSWSVGEWARRVLLGQERP
jgi:transcriptional regulator with XRE-family HTH domain